MHIRQPHYYELIDRVVHEGEPELLLGPLVSPPSDLPPAWGEVLTAEDPRAAVAALWQPMADRLPRVWRALQERLPRVGLLRTEEVPVSLIYFFSDGDDSVKYRGRLPLAETKLAASRLPEEFLDFYRIHDGWVLYYSEDGGPAPSTEWLPLSDLWTEVDWKLPPGEVSLDTLTSVFRDGDELALAYDTSASSGLPLLCRDDGTIDVLLDMWAAIDREIGLFLEELDPAGGVTAIDHAPIDLEHEATRLLKRFPERRAAAAQLGGACVHEQAYDHFLERAWIARRGTGAPEKVVENYRQALQEWCACIGLGGQTNPEEVLDLFGLAHALGDAATGHFVASIPTPIWADDSLEAAQAQVLFYLVHGDMAFAATDLEELLGLAFDGEEPPEQQTEIVVRLLESLCGKNARAFREWRRKAVDKLCASPAERNSRLPWEIKLAGFDEVAFRLGMAEHPSRPLGRVD